MPSSKRKTSGRPENAIDRLVRMVKEGFDRTATKDDIVDLKKDIANLSDRLGRVESEVDALIDVTLTDPKKRVTAVERDFHLLKR